MENRARIEQNDNHFLTEFAQLIKCQKGADFAPWATTMQFLGRRSYILACGRRWGSADALLYGVLETCARSRANLRQILTSWSVFSYRGPAKIG